MMNHGRTMSMEQDQKFLILAHNADNKHYKKYPYT